MSQEDSLCELGARELRGGADGGRRTEVLVVRPEPAREACSSSSSSSSASESSSAAEGSLSFSSACCSASCAASTSC